MPTRSLSSRVLRWPDAETVVRAAERWATALAQVRKDIISIGYIGSYARGDWGVGSDLDVIAVVEKESELFHERGMKFDTSHLPVPVDLLVYTAAEWDAFRNNATRFSDMLRRDLKWLYQRG